MKTPETVLTVVPEVTTTPSVASPETRSFLPAHIARQGERASRRFLEFFAAEIENDNTRATYFRAVRNFFAWCDERGFHELESIGPVVVAAYV